MIFFSKKRIFRIFCTVVFLAGSLFAWAAGVQAQVQFQLTHQVTIKVPVRGNNFVKAREDAVSQAFRSALEQSLRSWMGDEKFAANRKEMAGILAQADRYVQSYRFIEAVDDPIEKTSAVILEVTVFPDALGKSLNRAGVAMGSEGVRNVVILIAEKSITSGEPGSFWDTMPISEASLVQRFAEAGVNVVPRDPISQAVSEETVLNAVKGDMRDAVQIGLKTGADIVILGNAVSNSLKDSRDVGKTTVQTNLSVRVVSALQSTIIAAKSDFATSGSNDLLAGELEAFGEVSQKVSDFLLSSINGYWEAGTSPHEAPHEASQPAASPLPLGDL